MVHFPQLEHLLSFCRELWRLRNCCVTTTAAVFSTNTQVSEALTKHTHTAWCQRSAGRIHHIAAFSSEWAAWCSSLQQVPSSASENPSSVLKAALCTHNVSLQQELNPFFHPSVEERNKLLHITATFCPLIKMFGSSGSRDCLYCLWPELALTVKTFQLREVRKSTAQQIFTMATPSQTASAHIAIWHCLPMWRPSLPVVWHTQLPGQARNYLLRTLQRSGCHKCQLGSRWPNQTPRSKVLLPELMVNLIITTALGGWTR